MKKELVDLQPKLEQAKIDNTKIMKVRNRNIYLTIILGILFLMKKVHVFFSSAGNRG